MGSRIRPATTEGSAAFHPGDGDHASVASSAARCSSTRWSAGDPHVGDPLDRAPAASAQTRRLLGDGEVDVPAATTATVASMVRSAAFTTTSRACS